MRRKVYQGVQMDEYVKVIKILDENSISYTVKVKSLDGSESGFFAMSASSSRRSKGQAFMNKEIIKEYSVYVKSSDYETAKHVLGT